METETTKMETTKTEPNGSKQGGAKQIKETKCTCSGCGNVWFYGKEDVLKSTVDKLHNAGKAMTCCGGCFPALLIPNKKEVDLNKCPKCGSRAVTKETVIHNV